MHFPIEATEHEHRRFAEALAETAAALNATLKLDEVLDRILEQAARVVRYDASSIALIDNGYARIVRCQGFAERGLEDFVLNQQFKIDTVPHYVEMMHNPQPQVFVDAQSEPSWVDRPETSWIHGHITTPIISRGEVIGFLHLDSAIVGAFQLHHADRLRVFADQVAIAIQNARHADELERRVDERTNELLQLIEERKRMEFELRRALERERELNDLKTRFISNTSHEFRTPLALIMTSSDLLRTYYHKLTDEQRIERLDRIQTEVQKMAALLSDVLTVSQTDSPAHHEFNPIPVDLVAFCTMTIGELQVVDPREIRLTHEGDCTQRMVDRDLLNEVLVNLLSNALKYSVQSIHLAVRCDAEHTTFTITDRGIGIPEADQQRIFDVFHRGSNVGHLPGTGLGLTIAKQSAELQGGSIRFESREGVGSTFVFTIPHVSL
ncbi:MAG: GAF domain-containing sensor histidine kinase [Anaerolineae bacterium]|nr:GAF domain-containing sensor histidine kinase [Anaerolineae bacterium]